MKKIMLRPKGKRSMLIKILYIFLILFTSSKGFSQREYTCSGLSTHYENIKTENEIKKHVLPNHSEPYSFDSVIVLNCNFFEDKYPDLLSINNFKNVEYLSLKSYSTFFDKEFLELKKIVELVLIMPNLIIDSNLINNLSKFNNLKYITFVSNNLSELPQNFSKLSHLYGLKISSENFKDFSNVICNFDSLKILRLYGTKITGFPDCLMPNLKELKIENQENYTYKLNYDNYPNLEVLIINSFHSDISELLILRNLEVLSIDNLNLEDFPCEITVLENLVCVFFENSPMKFFNCDLSQFKNLKMLGLNKTKIEDEYVNYLRKKYKEISFIKFKSPFY